MNNKAEKVVSKFYNTIGWESNEGLTEDAKRWEDSREVAREYVSKCRLRVLRQIPSEGDKILDMASGPIQYPEYLKYSEKFKKRYCVDLSTSALAEALAKIGDHGVFLEGSFFDINLEENFFDCSISLHTIYHIDKDMQEKAVRKLLYVTKPGKPIIVVYSNPNTLISLPSRLIRSAKNFLSCKNLGRDLESNSALYFYQHPNDWWRRFEDIATVKMYPWRSFAANFTKLFVPNNTFGKKILDVILNLEDRFPNFFVKYFQYQMIVLIKKD
jgi:ubiquinone/menaquinone biosynthesis C-methylase UbiE